MSPKSQLYLKVAEVGSAIVLALAVAYGVFVYLQTVQEIPIARGGGFASACYQDSQGAAWRADSGCTWNVMSGGTLQVDSGSTLTLPAGSITAASVANITRTVSISLMDFIECTTDAGAAINFTDGADAFPDFINSSTNGLGFSLTFDATGGSVDTAFVCVQVLVPFNYVSGGAVKIEATKGAETGANTEVLNCAGSINSAALGTAGTVTLTGTAAASYSCTPTLTALAAGNSLGLELHITSGGTADDSVIVWAVGFEYTASQ